MIKKIVGTTILLMFLLGDLIAQPGESAQKKITLNDLKPKINYVQSEPFYQPIREKSGLALISSAVIPGSGQAANKKWLRAGLYFAAEVIFVGVHLKKYNDAKAEQRRYERFADNNWSVVTYAKWLIDYHDQNNLQNSYIDDLKAQIGAETADYDPDTDWQKVDIELLRNVEQNTPFVYPDQDEIGNKFSHVMPDYGSQQYYELISKYYQYGPGWNDFNVKYQLQWDGSDMPSNFMQGSALAEKFNNSYRLAGNMVSLIILNHIVSAFDAFLTVKIQNNRLEANSNLLDPQRTFSLKFHF